MRHVAAVAALAVLAAACGSTEVKQVPPPAASSATARPAPAAAASRTTPSSTAPVAGNPLRDPKNILSQRSVYFDFDESAVKSEYQNLVQAHAKHLALDRAARMRIEGNCDERGSREYNLALGQRRSQAVKNVMKVLGVDDGRIEAISFGEDKPVAQGHDEASWARNRRADLKYSGE
jgi:peptidoglycan-associated lipoprotein